MVVTVAATTDRATARSVADRPARAPRRSGSGPDRLTVLLLSLAGFLAVLALLAWQLQPSAQSAAKPVMVVKREYTTTVIETVPGSSGAGGTSVSQSVSSSGGGYAASAAPTTRSS